MPPTLGGKSFVTSSELNRSDHRLRELALRMRHDRRPTGARVEPAAQQREADAPAERARDERRPVAADLRDTTEDERAESLREVEERAEGADDRRALALVDTLERERQQRGIEQRHPDREDGRAEEQSGDGRPGTDDDETRRTEAE